MGRAERRQMERRNRIEDRKGKVALSRQEIAELKEKITIDASAYGTEALMTCFALSLHELYGFGFKRIENTLVEIDRLMSYVLDDTCTIEDYKKQLENKTGIIIKCGG